MSTSVSFRFLVSSALLMCAVASQAQPARAASSPAEASEWATHNGNASHDGYVPLVTKPANFRVLWTTSLPAGNHGYNPAATGDGSAFISNKVWFETGLFYALDLTSGQVRWQHEFHSPVYGGVPIMNAPAYKNGVAYVSTGGHEDAALWGYASQTGAQKFRSSIEAQWETYYAPTPFGNSLYMNGGYYGGAYSFRARDGRRNWFTSLPQYDRWTPAVDAEHVYAYTTQLDIIDRRTGAIAASIPDPNFEWMGYSVGCAPVLGSLNNVLVTQGSRMVSFDLGQRKVAWEAPVTTGYYEINQISLANGVIYYANGGTVEMRNEADGGLLRAWTPPQGGAIESTILVTQNLFFVSTSNGTYAVDRQKPVGYRWKSSAHGHLSMSKNGTLVIVGADGTVTGVQTQTTPAH